MRLGERKSVTCFEARRIFAVLLQRLDVNVYNVVIRKIGK